jgi:hypothetical protein
MLGSFTNAEWEQMKLIQRYTCVGCGESEPFIKLVRDHIVPVSRGGTNEWSNIQPLCEDCNCRKHAKTIFFLEGFRVSDISVVPREFMKVSTVKLEAAIALGVRVIPGVEIYEAA